MILEKKSIKKERKNKISFKTETIPQKIYQNII